MKSRKKIKLHMKQVKNAAAAHTLNNPDTLAELPSIGTDILEPYQDPGDWIVYKKVAGTYEVRSEGRAMLCRLSPELRSLDIDLEADPRVLRQALKAKRAALHTDPVVVGDAVEVVGTGDGTGVILNVLPRRSRLSRRSAVPMPGAHAFEQIIAANVDQVAPVFSAANPAPKWNLLDRYLVSAESLELVSLIVITKTDLTPGDEDLAEAVELYRAIGYPVVLTSAADGTGLESLKASLEGKITVLVGKSGVGKTSLLNALQPGLGLRVNAVSQVTGKGRHTTTHQELFPIDSDSALSRGGIIDTPGIREFGLWEVDASDVTYFFPEMRPFLGKCRFGLGCRHDEEPGCAVRKAVAAGFISPPRYFSYLSLRNEVSE
jgi:ribosome biogenesis GTPase